MVEPTSDFINDNVHGRVEVTPLERAIIRTPTFRRLSNISQLGFAYWVFPGARHSRAAHSIGTLHVMSKVARQLGLGEQEQKLLRLAALLHDIGQYPFSHVIERVYRRIGKVPTGQVFQGLEPQQLRAQTSIQRAAVPPRGEKYARDKDLAGEVIRKRPDLRNVLDAHDVGEKEREEVIQIIQGKHSCKAYTLLMDSDFDCDRLDYVVRDASLAGVRYGQIELDYLIENMSLKALPGHRQNSIEQTVAINKQRALHTLDHYLTARYYMYSQIVFHRTVRSFELLAEAIFQDLARIGVAYRNYDAIVKDVGTPAFLGFDDSYFFSRIHAYYEREDAEENLKNMIGNFLEGRRPELVREEMALVDDSENMPLPYRKLRTVAEHPDLLARVCKRASVDPQHVVTQLLGPLEFLPVGSTVRLSELMKRSPKDWNETVHTLPCLYDAVSKRTEYLAMDNASILKVLASYHLYLLRVYLDDGSEQLVTALNQSLGEEIAQLP